MGQDSDPVANDRNGILSHRNRNGQRIVQKQPLPYGDKVGDIYGVGAGGVQAPNQVTDNPAGTNFCSSFWSAVINSVPKRRAKAT